MRRAEAEAFEAMQFGDLDVLAHLPAKMLKALAVIADRAHPAYDECSGVAAGASKDKCLFMSLAVRDFLVEIGYRDATVRSCSTSPPMICRAKRYGRSALVRLDRCRRRKNSTAMRSAQCRRSGC
jgi:hypothetical protein